MKEKVVIARSGGKDSALILYVVLNSGVYVLESLTTFIQLNFDFLYICFNHEFESV